MIMNDTLDFSKIESGEFRISVSRNSLSKSLSDAVSSMSSFAAVASIDLFLTVDPKLPDSCLFDAGRIQQVLANLLSNAIKFTPHDGSGRVVVAVTTYADDEEIMVQDCYWQNESKFSELYPSQCNAAPVAISSIQLPRQEVSDTYRELWTSEKYCTLVVRYIYLATHC